MRFPHSSWGGLEATVTGLTDGVEYQFAVRARDAQGNRDGNLVLRMATPTHPFDDTPPVFGGVESAADAGNGGRVLLTWDPATDPDTPESSGDPSVPILYEVYLAESATGLGTGTPTLVTSSPTGTEIGGLSDSVTYYVLVRAVDSVGNSDDNTRVLSFRLSEPIWSYWWLFVPIAVALGLVFVMLWRRRGADVNPPRQPPAPPPGEDPRSP